MKKLYRKSTVHPSPPLISDHLSFLPAAILTLAAALSQEDKEVLAYLISCSSGDFSGNRRTTHKSNTTNSPPPTSTPAAGDFSGGRRSTHLKSAAPSSGSDNSGGSGGGDGLKGTSAAVHGGVHGGVGGGADHLSSFNCYCFSCYMSYWVKWDSSPNRQLIHEILDAYEDGLQSKKSKKERRNKNGSSSKQNGSSLNKNGSSKDDVGSSTELKKSSSESSLNKNGSGSGSGFGSGQSDPVEETSGSHGGGDGGDEEETGGCEKGSVRKFVSFLGERIWSVWT